MRVFVSHASRDKPAVLALAEALRAQNIEPWLDKWEIGPAGDIVGSINRGLHEADAGIIVFSAASAASRWVDAEANYLTWARIEEGKPLIPVILGDDAFIPPLLRPLVRHRITDIAAIVEALHNRKPAPTTPLGAAPGRRIAVLIALRRTTGSGIEITLDIDGTRHGTATQAGLPADLAQAQTAFLQGRIHGHRRDGPGPADRSARYASRNGPAPRSPP